MENDNGCTAHANDAPVPGDKENYPDDILFSGSATFTRCSSTTRIPLRRYSISPSRPGRMTYPCAAYRTTPPTAMWRGSSRPATASSSANRWRRAVVGNRGAPRRGPGGDARLSSWSRTSFNPTTTTFLRQPLSAPKASAWPSSISRPVIFTSRRSNDRSMCSAAS